MVWHCHAFQANTQLDIPGSPLYPPLNLYISSGNTAHLSFHERRRTPTIQLNFSLLVLYEFTVFLTDTKQGSTSSGMEQPFVFSGCVTLLCPVCFHYSQKGSVIKFSFLCLFLCLTVFAVGWLVSSCCGGTLGTQAIVLREVTGRSDPKSMRKQLCCSKLYFCQAGSSERSWDIRNPKWEDR